MHRLRDMNLNTQFAFEGNLKRNLMIGMALGALCLVLTFFFDDEYHMRFWSNFLHNAVFFTGISFTIMLFLSASITAFAGWMTAFKRVWEAISQFMWVGMILMGVIAIGVLGHFHHLYHWNTPGINDPTNPIFDKILAGKSGFLNPIFFTVGVVGFLGIWYYWAYKLRQTSVDQDTMETSSFDFYKKQRKWAASFLPICGFMSTVFLWQSVMSIDGHWYSTMFAWYATISVLLAGLALTILLLIFLKSKGYMSYVTREHFHDIGKYMFGLSIFWAYLWFDQFMLIWYANVGEETIYFKERMNNYPVLFWGNLLMNFISPFFILMRNDTKRKFGTLFIAAAIVFFGHWWDYFYMIKPGTRIASIEAKELSEGKHTSQHDAAAPMSHTSNAAPAEEHMANAEAAQEGEAAPTENAAPHATAAAEVGHEAGAHGEDAHGEEGHGTHSFLPGFTLPGFLEIGTFIGFLSLFLFFFFNQLQKASLLPAKDPYLEESLHFSTGVYPEGEDHGDGGH